MSRRRLLELTDHVEADRPQRIADNNQNFIQHHNMTPVFTEHQTIYGRDTTMYNYPRYDPSYSGQPPRSIIGSPLLHQQMAQHTIGSTAWFPPSNNSNDLPYSFSRYTSAPGLGLSDAHFADTPPITYAQFFNYDTHYKIQSPGGSYFGHVVNDELEPPIALTQPVRYDTYRPLRLPEESYFGPIVNDGSEADTHLADSTPTKHITHSTTSTTWQSLSNIYYDPPYSFSHCTSAPGPGLSDAHLADTPPITHFNYDIHYQIQSPGGPYFGHVVNDGLEADTHLADSTPIIHHQLQLAEVGPTVNDESDFNASRCPYTCMWRNCGQIAAEGVAGHMTTFHLIRGETHDVCQWRGCRRSKPYRRDTICRHIREVHLKERRPF